MLARGGQPHLGPQPGAGTLVGRIQPHRSAVPAYQLPHDRQPQPGAAGVAGAGVVEPGEPARRPAPGPRPGCPDRRRPPSPGGTPPSDVTAERDPRAGVPDRVVDQVGHHPAQRLRLARGSTPPASRRRSPARGRRRTRAATAHNNPPSSTGSATGPAAGASSARASSSRSSTSRASRAVSASRSSTSAGQSCRRPSRCATSSWVRMFASGLRSSWAASATNARCRARAASSRSSMPLRVTASRWISSRGLGTGSRPGAGRAGDLLAPPAQRLHRAQGGARPPARRPAPARPAAAGTRPAGSCCSTCTLRQQVRRWDRATNTVCWSSAGRRAPPPPAPGRRPRSGHRR